MKISKIRIGLLITGLIHILVFFAIPYAKLVGIMSGIGQLAGALGMGDSYPETLTGLSAVKMANTFGGDAILILVIFLVPVIAGVLTSLVSILGKGKLSYELAGFCGFIAAICYGLATIALQDFAQVGYQANYLAYVMVALSAVQFIMGIIGSIKSKKKKGSSNKGKNAKVGKKDGAIIGVTGSYAGASIPVKSGDTVVIGRDPSTCNIIVKGEKVSRKHCTVSFNADNGMYAVTDLSTNGVFDKDGGRLPENTTVPMSAGSEIHIGEAGDIFRLG